MAFSGTLQDNVFHVSMENHATVGLKIAPKFWGVAYTVLVASEELIAVG